VIRKIPAVRSWQIFEGKKSSIRGSTLNSNVLSFSEKDLKVQPKGEEQKGKGEFK